jgi:hypothetical protein
MSTGRPLASVRTLLPLAACAAVAGCPSSPVVVNAPLDRSHENLMHIGTAYDRFTTRHAQAPTGVEQLRPFLKELGDPDELLRSPRDGEPYAICWGVDLRVRPKWATSTPVLAYEKRGADGKRYVLTTLRSVSLMTDQEFKQASFPPGHLPPP